MKIAYGTYAMPKHPLEESIPILDRIGYDGIEICAGPRHVGSLPEAMTPERRAVVRELLVQHSMGVPATFATTIHAFEPDAGKHAEDLELAKSLADLMRAFVPDREPVLASGADWRAAIG